MTRRDVVVDASALVAALDRRDSGHGAARHTLDRLLDDVAADRVVLVTHTDAVTEATRRLASLDSEASTRVAHLVTAFDVVPLHADLLRDARSVQETAAGHGVELPFDTALTIELTRRRGTRRVMSFDPLLHLFDLERLLDGQSKPA